MRAGVLVTGLVSCESVLLLHLNVILTFVCLKRFVIFLICAEVYLNVAQCVLVSVVAGGGGCGWVALCCILCFSLNSWYEGRLLLRAICCVFFHSSCRSLLSGRVNIFLMRNL